MTEKIDISDTIIHMSDKESDIKTEIRKNDIKDYFIMYDGEVYSAYNTSKIDSSIIKKELLQAEPKAKFYK